MNSKRVSIPPKIMGWLTEKYGPTIDEQFRNDTNIVIIALAQLKSNETYKTIKIKFDKNKRCIIIEK